MQQEEKIRRTRPTACRLVFLAQKCRFRFVPVLEFSDTVRRAASYRAYSLLLAQDDFTTMWVSSEASVRHCRHVSMPLFLVAYCYVSLSPWHACMKHAVVANGAGHHKSRARIRPQPCWKHSCKKHSKRANPTSRRHKNVLRRMRGLSTLYLVSYLSLAVASMGAWCFFAASFKTYVMTQDLPSPITKDLENTDCTNLLHTE